MQLPIVQFKPSAHPDVQGRIVPGSIIIAKETSAGLQLDFEGGIYQRPSSRPPTRDEQIEYAKRAAGRAHKHYPTMARLYLADAVLDRDFLIIGWVDTDTWEVALFPIANPPHSTPESHVTSM